MRFVVIVSQKYRTLTVTAIPKIWDFVFRNNYKKGVYPAFRCTAKNAPPTAIGSLPAAFPKRIRLALFVIVHWELSRTVVHAYDLVDLLLHELWQAIDGQLDIFMKTEFTRLAASSIDR